MSYYPILSIGLLAQLLFSARLIAQWIVSEKAKKVLSPTIFWQLSIIASFLLCIYGWLRHDFSIILGQIISYYIYIWNLNSKGWWKTIHPLARTIFFFIPIVSVAYFLLHWDKTFTQLFMQSDIPSWLIVLGVIGQFIFTFRFIYQWWYSRKAGESLLPAMFWIISLVGSAIIILYAIIRHDVVLIIGQAAGFIVYARNLIIEHKATRQQNICQKQY